MGSPAPRRRRPTIHEYEPDSSVGDLTVHLKGDHGYVDADSPMTVELRHTTLDIALGVMHSIDFDARTAELRLGRAKRGYDELLLPHLSEDHVRDHDEVLDRRIRVFTESVGSLDAILGDVENDLRDICLREAEDAKAAVRRYELDLETKLSRARRKESQERDLVMDMRSYRRDEVAALMGQRPRATPQELEVFVERGLSRYPAGRLSREVDGVIKIAVPMAMRQRHKGLADAFTGTFDYRVALRDERLDFFAIGHPVVDALVSECSTQEFCASPGLLFAGPNPEGMRPELAVDYEFRMTGVRVDCDYCCGAPNVSHGTFLRSGVQGRQGGSATRR